MVSKPTMNLYSFIWGPCYSINEHALFLRRHSFSSHAFSLSVVGLSPFDFCRFSPRYWFRPVGPMSNNRSPNENLTSVCLTRR
jgi:hypothetical protein